MKLRKFITGLAVGALMVVTMATGVFAATSPSKESTSTVAGVSGLNIKNDGVDCSLPTIVTPVTTATQAQAEAAANKIGYTVIKFFDLEETELSVYKYNTTVKMMVDNVLAGMKVKVLHLPDGKDGELVFTTLGKEGMPMIRYRTRDICHLIREKCACGRTTVRMSRVFGRTDDMLIIRGVNVFPSQIETVIGTFKELTINYKIVVGRVHDRDTFELHVELAEGLDIDDIAFNSTCLVTKNNNSLDCSALSNSERLGVSIAARCGFITIDGVVDIATVIRIGDSHLSRAHEWSSTINHRQRQCIGIVGNIGNINLRHPNLCGTSSESHFLSVSCP